MKNIRPTVKLFESEDMDKLYNIHNMDILTHFERLPHIMYFVTYIALPVNLIN